MVKKISIIGVGKLGLALGLNLEKKGFEVLGIDLNSDYIDNLNNKSFFSSEPFIMDFLKSSKNISFSTDIEKSLENDVIFVVVKTPSTFDWKYDHSQIDDVVDKLISLGRQERRKDLIINSTTFPGYCDSVQKKLNDLNYFVSYNPEFIAQGSIIQDQLNCDSVLIGQSDNYSGNLIEYIYTKMCNSNPKINKMSRTESEITKLSVNCFLTTKISFANMIGDIAERMNCNPSKILSAVGSDSRIGEKYLKYGFGFGGPCFPRDNRALSKFAEEVGIDAIISKATDEMNKKHLDYQVENFTNKNPNKEIPVIIDFLSYKKESVLIEESQQLKFAVKLKELGYHLKINEKRKEVLNQVKNLI